MMEIIDPEIAQRVWQRVTGGSPQPDIRQLCCLARENRLLLQLLADELTGRHAEQVRQMLLQERRDEAVLRGIGLLRGEQIHVAAAKPARVPAARCLEISCRRALQLARQYALYTSDSEFGPVFSRLACRRQEQAETLMAILGERTEKGVRL